MQFLVVSLFILAFQNAFAVILQTQGDWLSQNLSEAVLSHKCSQILKAHPWFCDRVTQEFVKKLDVQVVTSPVANRQIVYLKTDTLQILSSPRLKGYLLTLKEQLNNLENDNISEFDLYAASVEFLGSPEQADRWIGLLFQDNNFSFHKQWVRNLTFAKADLKELYLTIYDRLSLRKNKKYARIIFYPQWIQSNYRHHFSDKIYYYFLPKLIQRKLRELPLPANLDDFQIQEFRRVTNSYSMMVTLLYMYHHLYGGALEGVLKRPVSMGFWDGSGFVSNGTLEKHKTDKNTWLNRYRDLYMAYLASLTKPESQLMPFAEFTTLFWTNPLKGIQEVNF